MKDDKRTDLYPPVLPSWGSMMPSSPPSEYGNIRFDPDRLAAPRAIVENTELDEQAICFLSRIFQRRYRPVPL